jgi:hypothetical protein
VQTSHNLMTSGCIRFTKIFVSLSYVKPLSIILDIVVVPNRAVDGPYRMLMSLLKFQLPSVIQRMFLERRLQLPSVDNKTLNILILPQNSYLGYSMPQ